MKRGNLIFRCISLACILVILLVYQKIATERAEVIAANEAEVQAVEAYNREIEMKMSESQASRGVYGQDGVFYGSGTGYGGLIEVAVSIQDGWIVDVEVVSHEKEDQAYFGMAVQLIDDILDSQSTEVDVVSGATFSSNGIIEAVSQALEGTN